MGDSDVHIHGEQGVMYQLSSFGASPANTHDASFTTVERPSPAGRNRRNSRALPRRENEQGVQEREMDRFKHKVPSRSLTYRLLGASFSSEDGDSAAECFEEGNTTFNVEWLATNKEKTREGEGDTSTGASGSFVSDVAVGGASDIAAGDAVTNQDPGGGSDSGPVPTERFLAALKGELMALAEQSQIAAEARDEAEAWGSKEVESRPKERQKGKKGKKWNGFPSFAAGRPSDRSLGDDAEVCPEHLALEIKEAKSKLEKERTARIHEDKSKLKKGREKGRDKKAYGRDSPAAATSRVLDHDAIQMVSAVDSHDNPKGSSSAASSTFAAGRSTDHSLAGFEVPSRDKKATTPSASSSFSAGCPRDDSHVCAREIALDSAPIADEASSRLTKSREGEKKKQYAAAAPDARDPYRSSIAGGPAIDTSVGQEVVFYDSSVQPTSRHEAGVDPPVSLANKLASETRLESLQARGRGSAASSQTRVTAMQTKKSASAAEQGLEYKAYARGKEKDDAQEDVRRDERDTILSTGLTGDSGEENRQNSLEASSAARRVAAAAKSQVVEELQAALVRSEQTQANEDAIENRRTAAPNNHLENRKWEIAQAKVRAANGLQQAMVRLEEAQEMEDEVERGAQLALESIGVKTTHQMGRTNVSRCVQGDVVSGNRVNEGEVDRNAARTGISRPPTKTSRRSAILSSFKKKRIIGIKGLFKKRLPRKGVQPPGMLLPEGQYWGEEDSISNLTTREESLEDSTMRPILALQDNYPRSPRYPEFRSKKSFFDTGKDQSLINSAPPREGGLVDPSDNRSLVDTVRASGGQRQRDLAGSTHLHCPCVWTCVDVEDERDDTASKAREPPAGILNGLEWYASDNESTREKAGTSCSSVSSIGWYLP